MIHTTDQACNRQLTKMAQIDIEILKFSLSESKSIFNTKFMLIVKLDYGFRLNLYLGFDIYVVDFDI